MYDKIVLNNPDIGLDEKLDRKIEIEKNIKKLIKESENEWDKEIKRQNISIIETYVDELVEFAENIQMEMEEILTDSLYPDEIRLEELLDYSKYLEPYPQTPNYKTIPDEPYRCDLKYNPKPTLLQRIIPAQKEEFNALHTAEFEKDHVQWEENKAILEKQNFKLLQDYNSKIKKWKNERDAFEKLQKENNEKIKFLYKQYRLRNSEGIEWYFKILLNKIALPFKYKRSIEIEYNVTNKTLIVDILLPEISDIPNVKNVSYVKARNILKNTYYSESYLKKKYESVIYQIVLQTLHYIFYVSDGNSIIDFVILNGKIDTIDKSTGKNIKPYILSVSVSRNAFEEIDLENVDPKAWFKSSKGVSAQTLANITPIAPMVMMKKTDKRFIEGYNVADSLDDSVNLAAIDWQDFENLIREIFEKEFNVNGGEVKITQASRDGGVDAVAFDPDPIRGGKIVIQAKRYTNIVGVSAVRDLYGTVLNEGATKGILVTTSNYGSDAYDFANGKPLTLMNGANLLYLLQKHGYKARINLKEAKQLLSK